MATYQNTHVVDVPLSNYMIGRTLDANSPKLIVPKIFRPFPVPQDDGRFMKYDEERADDRLNDLERLEDDEAVEVKNDYTTQSFSSKTIAAKSFISDKLIRNATEVVKKNHRKGQALSLTKKLLKKRELDGAAILFDSANYTNTVTLAGIQQWNNYATSTPFEDIEARALGVVRRCEEEPNTILMGREVWSFLKNHPDLLGRLSDTSAKTLSISAFKSLLNDANMNIENVYIGSIPYNSAKLGAAYNSQFLWGKHFLIGYVNPDTGILYQETLAQMFVPDSVQALTVEYYRQSEKKGETVECNATYALEMVSSDCGGFIENAVA